MVEKVIDTHENAKIAKKKLQEYKAQIGELLCTLTVADNGLTQILEMNHLIVVYSFAVQQVTEESRELMKQALEEVSSI